MDSTISISPIPANLNRKDTEQERHLLESLIGKHIEPLSRDGRTWTFEETRMAFVLYLMLEPREYSKTGADVVQLAQALGRKPGSVAKKLGNIQANDKYRSHSKGLTHINKFDKLVWEEYEKIGDQFLEESLALLLAMENDLPATKRMVEYGLEDLPPEGKERLTTSKQRINQSYFRTSLLENYNHRCCLTGIAVDELLIASHIKPWKDANPRTERTSPSNGLLLNAFHDRAFDKGLITLDDSFCVIVSPKVKRNFSKHPDGAELILEYEGKQIELPKKMPPSLEFIHWHNENVFIA